MPISAAFSGGGSSLTVQQTNVLDHILFNPITDQLETDRTLETILNSFKLGKQWTITAGGEQAYFKTTSTGLQNYPAWGGIKDQSIVANQDATGLVHPQIRTFADNLVAFNPVGTFDSSGIVPYELSITVAASAAAYSIETILEESVADTDWIAYEIFFSPNTGNFPVGAIQHLDFQKNESVSEGLGQTPDDVLTVFRPGAPEDAFPESLAGDTVTKILAGKLIRTDAGLYVHSIRANNMKDSFDFGPGSKWTLRGSPLVNDGDQLDPEGLMTASTMSVGASGVLDFFQQVNGFPAATQFEPSFFIKRATTTGVFRVQKVSSADSQTGQWDVDMALLPDAWIRLTALHAAVTVVEAFISDISTFTFTGMHFFSPDGVTRTFDLWGVQLEAKGGVSPFLKTAGDFSSSILFTEVTQPISQMGFGVGEGTIVIDALMPIATVIDDAFVFSISDNSITNSLTLSREAGVWAVKHTIAGATSSQTITGITDGTQHRIAFGWKADGMLNVSVDGGAVQTFATQDAQNFVPQVDFNLGSHPDGQFNLESTIQSLTSYPDYSDALLQARSNSAVIQTRSLNDTKVFLQEETGTAYNPGDTFKLDFEQPVDRFAGQKIFAQLVKKVGSRDATPTVMQVRRSMSSPTNPWFELSTRSFTDTRIADRDYVDNSGLTSPTDFTFSAILFRADIVGGGGIANVNSTSTIPGLLPDASNLGTGIGSVTNDKLSLIANSKEIIRIDGVGANRDVTLEGKMTIGPGTGSPTLTTLLVEGAAPGLVDGDQSGQLIVRSSGTGVNDTAVLTGHSRFGGGDQQWYLGGVSSSNQHVAFINRKAADFQIWTNNALSMKITSEGTMSMEKVTGGFVLSNVTTVERDAITIQNGMMIYNTTLNKAQVVENNVWVNLI